MFKKETSDSDFAVNVSLKQNHYPLVSNYDMTRTPNKHLVPMTFDKMIVFDALDI